jgi:[histone H3]-lysine9 N-trimethyltransferase SUV39H
MRVARVPGTAQTASWSVAVRSHYRSSGRAAEDGVCVDTGPYGPSGSVPSVLTTRAIPLGVKTTVDLKKGQFVDRYIGEIITAKEANYRRKVFHIAQKKDVYLFALDKFHDPDSLDPRLSQPPLLVDGEFMSGPTRFINHSCNPNLRIFARVGDHADKHLHDLALFAIEDIKAGDELTFDYVDGEEDGDDDLHNPDKVKDMTKCLCGSKNCRGFLW